MLLRIQFVLLILPISVHLGGAKKQLLRAGFPGKMHQFTKHGRRHFDTFR